MDSTAVENRRTLLFNLIGLEMTSLKFKNFWHVAVVYLGVLMLQISLLISPAFAEQACDDLWYSRNFYFDQAGYCFGSNLGRSIFDNSNCKSKNVALPDSAKHRISQIKEIENNLECNINTSKVRLLDIPQFAARNSLIEQPISQGLESSCFGYTGESKIPLYAGTSENSKVVGYIEKDDDVISYHDELTNRVWWFAGSTDNNGKNAVGWTKAEVFGQCKSMAG